MSGISHGRLDTDVVRELLVGAVDSEIDVGGDGEYVVPQRLPAAARSAIPTEVFRELVALPMGVRLRMTTAARAIVVHARVAITEPPGATPPVMWTVVSDGRLICRVDARRAGAEHLRGHAVVLAIGGDGRQRGVEIWLPHNAVTGIARVQADAELLPWPAASGIRWTHYGSSISQGLNARDSLGSWPVQAARELGVELTSMAFSGNAMLDAFVARSIAETPADVISVKIGINLVNAASMTRRTFGPAVDGFLGLIRVGHPRTPIIVMTALACPMHEDVPGPTVLGDDGLFAPLDRPPHDAADALTLRDTRRLVADVVSRLRSAGDDCIHLVDGLELFGSEDAHHLFDGLHPDATGLDLVAVRFAALVRARPVLTTAFAAGADTR